MLDAGVIIVTYVLSWYIRFRSGLFDLDPWYLSLREYMKVLFFWCRPIWSCITHFSSTRAEAGTGKKAGSLACKIQANVISLMGVTMVFFLAKLSDRYSRWVVFIFCFVNISHGSICQKYGEDGFAQGERTDIIRNIWFWLATAARQSSILTGFLQTRSEDMPCGELDDHQPRGMEYKGSRWSENRQSAGHSSAESDRWDCDHTGTGWVSQAGIYCKYVWKIRCAYKFIPDYNNIIPTKPYTEDIQDFLWSISVMYRLIMLWISLWSGQWTFLCDRCDHSFSPVMLVVSVLIKLTAPGPLIFKQERIGLQNKPFYMYKFRSMIVQKESEEKKADDKRWSEWLGRKFIRKTSIDDFTAIQCAQRRYEPGWSETRETIICRKV